MAAEQIATETAAAAAFGLAEPASRLTALGEHELLVFWTQLLVIVAAARLFGHLMHRIGMPSVIGYLTAGLILGPSVFGAVWPSGFEWFVPPDEISSGALFAVTWVGVALLLVTAGFETDLALIRRLGRAALLVASFSLAVPLLGGLAIGLVLPDTFVASGSDRSVFMMFTAAALSVSALAVIARILSELGLMRRDFGQITVAAGMVNDVIGWVMLAVFSGFATGGVSIGATLQTVLGLAAFLGLSVTVGQRAVDYCLREVRRSGPNMPGAVSVAVLTMLAFGVITQFLGIEAVLGAFLAGVILHRSRFQQQEVVHHIEWLTNSFLAPVFFVVAGMRVDLALITEGDALWWAGAVFAVAIVAKFAGAFAGARLAGQSPRAAAALGAGLNARGTLEIVIASVGLSTGVFSDTAYAVIVTVPLITSIFAAVSLRVIVRDWRGSDDERERLEREEALSRNLVVRSQRVLLASQGKPASIAASQILHFAWPMEAPVTVFSVRSADNALSAAIGSRRSNGGRPDITVIRNVLANREVDHRIVKADSVARAIVEESRLGYGAVCVGVATRHEGQLYSPMVDELLMRSPRPVLIVRQARNLTTPLPGAFARAIVPVTGTRSSRAAQEIAFGLSARLGTQIILTHVTTRWPSRRERVLAQALKLGQRARSSSSEARSDPVVESLMNGACALGAEVGVEPLTQVRQGALVGEALVDAADEADADLVVLGAALRNVDGRPFLGQTVETVLERCNANVVVVAMPRIVHAQG